MRPVTTILRVLPVLFATSLLAQTTHDTYLEFGTVVSVNKREIDVQIQDPRLNRLVQRSFALTRDSRADIVHVGDTVEVIYSPGTAETGGEWTLERLIALRAGLPIPKVGPAPPRDGAVILTANKPSPYEAAPTVPTRSKATLGRSTGTAAPSAVKAPAAAATSARITAPAPAGTPPTKSVTLANNAEPRVPGVSSVPLGAAPGSIVGAPRARSVAGQQASSDQCNRGADWANQPISIAVLDFRYPTEREESHDIGSTGGGSGTAVADLVFERLGKDAEFNISRGDRQKLFRMDFAGAARIGRQLGVDAVLLGTFAPVEQPATDPDFPPPTQAYTLRAGVVEVCTGVLLYRLNSVTCPLAASGTAAPGCPGSEITVKQASDPVENAAAFAVPIANLLGPLDRSHATSADLEASAGRVTSVNGATVAFRLNPGVSVKPGDQISVHALRLAKDPSTTTVQLIPDQEVGRVTVRQVTGGTATGTFAGDIPARPGDTANLLNN